ncbi:MAG: hypothetical protein CMH62_00585 [Nanoarchaeota archaeon]|nr:hypothetical protein [Nanoarchaeota archaeon]|tara:strand:+ start:835 stop:1722 length:888 start_codon:yes stop_codon:yes gene_type:complete
MNISVVIPTFNRKNKLINTLDSIKKSSFLDGVEIIIVDDGSSDGTKELLKKYSKGNLKIKYYYQDNQGPAQARNKGVELSKADIILFCGDDTLFHENLLKEHYEAHMKHKEGAVLGLCLWDENVGVNEFMRYIAPYGPQFNYSGIKDKENIGFKYFYTCNLSIGKKWFEFERFDTSFPNAAFEDIDLGYILEKKGLKIHYCKDAIVYHSHKYDAPSFYKRMEVVGKGAQIFINKHKNLKSEYMKSDKFPGSQYILKNIFNILARSRVLKKISLEKHWFFNIYYHKLKGVLLEKKN